MGWLSATIGAIGSIGAAGVQAAATQGVPSTTHAAKLSNKYNKDYATWSATQLPRLNRQGMEAAGFNPLLAINDGTGVSGGYQFSPAAQGQNPLAGLDTDLVGSAVDRYLQDKHKTTAEELAAKELIAKSKSWDAQNHKNNAEADLARAQAENVRAQTKKVGVETQYYGTGNPLTLLSRFGRETIPDVFRITNSAGNWIGDHVTSGAKSLWNGVKSMFRNSSGSGSPTQNMTPAQRSEYRKSGPHERPQAPRKSYRSKNGKW